LHRNSSRWSDPNTLTHLAHSRQSAFSKWSYENHILPISFEGTSQWLLKYILFSVPNLHCKDKNENSPSSKDGEGGSRYQKSTPQEELSANHVLAERRRREKLNERFIILRSLVPFVTKVWHPNTYVLVCVCARAHSHMYVCLYVCTHVNTHTRVRAHTHTRIRLYISLFFWAWSYTVLAIDMHQHSCMVQ